MNMKKNCLILAGVLLCSMRMTVLAGSINGAEASVIAAAQSVFEYNGKSYVADGWCIDALYGKFSEDGVDLSSTQASGLISMGYANIGRGVAEGYLIPIGGNNPADETEQEQEETKNEEIKETETNKNDNNKQNTAADQEGYTEPETYFRRDAIAGFGSVQKTLEEEKSSNWNCFLRYMLRQIYGLLPDIAQQMLSRYFPL